MFIGLDFKSCFDLDIIEKVDLIEKPPTEEVVTREELTELFKTIFLYIESLNIGKILLFL